MANQPTANAKHMPEITMLTILLQAAVAIKNKDGDPSLHGYVENQDFNPLEIGSKSAVEIAVLESIGDVLLQDHQILAAITANKEMRDGFVTVMVTPDAKAESDTEHPAEQPISEAKTFSSISATVVPNPNDRHNFEAGSSLAPLGNLRKVRDGISKWEQVKLDPLCCAVE